MVVTRTTVSSILQVSSVLEDAEERAPVLGSGGLLAPQLLAAEQLIERLSQLPLSTAWTEAIFCAETTREMAPTSAKELRGGDAALVRQVLAEAGEREAFLSGLAVTAPPLYGSFEAKTLCAVAACEPRSGPIASVRVITAPRFRRRGHAAAAVAALLRETLSAGQLAYLSVAVGNRAGIRLCERLGLPRVAVEEGMELAR